MLVKRSSISCIALACFGFVYCQFVNALPLQLTAKIGASLVFIVVSYIYMITQSIKNKGITNVLFIILCLSVFFYYGQHFLAIMDPVYMLEKQSFSILDGRITDECIINATFLAIGCLLLLTSGFLLHGEKKIVNNVFEKCCINNKIQNKLYTLKIVSILVLVISFYPTIRYLNAQYVLSHSYGYLGRRMLEREDSYFTVLGVSYLEIMISGLFLPSVYGLLISGKSKLSKLVSYVLLVIYMVLYFLTGSRFNLLKMFVTVYLIQVIWIKPLTKKDVKKYVAAGIAVVVLFAAGSVIRGMGNGQVDWQSVSDELSLSGTFWESGITFTTISNVLEQCPQNVPYFYGKSWLGSVLQCLPSIFRFGFFDKYTLQVSAVFSPLYYYTTDFGYGSSFIAEGYYNFGYFVLPVMLLFGYFLSWINDRLKLAKETASPYLFLILVTVCGELAFGVRNDLANVLRTTLVTVVVIVLFSFIVENMLAHRNRKGGWECIQQLSKKHTTL